MKTGLFLAAAAPLLVFATRTAVGNPIEKTVGLLTRLEQQITADGEAEAAVYFKFQQWCGESSSNKAFEVKTGERDTRRFEADIAGAMSDIEDATAKIDDLSKEVATCEADLKAAEGIREKESGAFKADEKDLMESVEMLGRAIDVLSKQDGDSPALLQATINTPSMQRLIASMTSIVDAHKLTSLIQGEPVVDGAAAKSIVEVMEDLRDKSEAELRAARAAEANAQHNFEMTKRALDAQADDAQTELEDQKKSKAASSETKAKKEGDLDLAKEQLADAKKMLKEIRSTCIVKGADRERAIAGEKEELKVLAQAKKAIQDATDGSEAGSFLQMSSSRRGTPQPSQLRLRRGKKTLLLLKRLATEQHSPALAQLASRASASMRLGAASGADPFVKVKVLITDMIARLEKEHAAEQSEKAYCDKEMSKTSAHKDELEDETDGLEAKLGEAVSASVALKNDVKTLQEELLKLEKTQGEADETRAEEHSAYLKSKEDLELALSGLRTAEGVLRDYYAADDKDDSESLLQTDDGDGVSLSAEMRQPKPPQKFAKATNAGNGIIDLLEVCASDVAKNLAEQQTQETDSQSEYDKDVQANKITKTQKEKDAEFKTREYKGLDKAIAELKADLKTANQELAAVTEYFAKVKERCVETETFEEKKAQRKAEIKGLQNALAILEGSAFLQ